MAMDKRPYDALEQRIADDAALYSSDNIELDGWFAGTVGIEKEGSALTIETLKKAFDSIPQMLPDRYFYEREVMMLFAYFHVKVCQEVINLSAFRLKADWIWKKF